MFSEQTDSPNAICLNMINSLPKSFVKGFAQEID